MQYAPEVFEFDIDGLAYVKNAAGDLLAAPGERADVPANLRLDVISSAKECPGDCIHVVRDGRRRRDRRDRRPSASSSGGAVAAAP